MKKDMRTIKAHYEQLSVPERLFLFLGACYRCDDQDMQTLLSTSPRDYVKTVKLVGRGTACRQTAMLYFIEQLSNCIGMLHAGSQIEEPNDQWDLLRAGLAFSITQRAAGWKLFSEENMIDDRVFGSLLPCWVSGECVMDLTLQLSHKYAPSQASELAARIGIPTEKVSTAPFYASHYQKWFEMELNAHN